MPLGADSDMPLAARAADARAAASAAPFAAARDAADWGRPPPLPPPPLPAPSLPLPELPRVLLKSPAAPAPDDEALVLPRGKYEAGGTRPEEADGAGSEEAWPVAAPAAAAAVAAP